MTMIMFLNQKTNRMYQLSMRIPQNMKKKKNIKETSRWRLFRHVFNKLLEEGYYTVVICDVCAQVFWGRLSLLQFLRNMKELSNVTSVVTNISINKALIEHIQIYISLFSLWESFYGEESFEGAHLLCTCHDLVLLQQMYIQGEKPRWFTKAYYLDT